MLTFASPRVRASSPSVPGRSSMSITSTSRSSATPIPAASSMRRATGAAASSSRMWMTPRPSPVNAHIPWMLTPADPVAWPRRASSPGRSCNTMVKSLGIAGSLLPGVYQQRPRGRGGGSAVTKPTPRGSLAWGHGKPARGGDKPVSPPAPRQPGGLVPVGRRRPAAGTRGGQADPAVDRVRGLPLVPRDGARVLRGSGHGGLHERALRLHQGRSRGAPRPRLDLHGGGPGDDRAWRLAADRLPRPRRGALLRRHLLPARATAGNGQPANGDGGGRGVLEHAAGTNPRLGGPDSRAARGDGTPRALGRASERRPAGHRGQPPTDAGRHAPRRVRGGAQVPAGSGPRVAPGPRRQRRRRGDPGRDGSRRHPRPDRRWLRALLGRRAVARAPLREDALRQRAARPRVPARLASARPGTLARRLRAHPRLGATRDAGPGGRLLLRPRRGLGGRGGALLPLDARRDSRRAGGGRTRRAGRGGHRVLRGHGGGQLRGPQHPPPPGRRVGV